jgi:hypothetical protein
VAWRAIHRSRKPARLKNKQRRERVRHGKTESKESKESKALMKILVLPEFPGDILLDRLSEGEGIKRSF